jgi:hypothetical protein
MSGGLQRHISPRTVTLITAVVLATILFAYLRLLVSKPRVAPFRPGGGGGFTPPDAPALGREDVRVELFAGIEPGYRDGPAWQAQFAGPNALVQNGRDKFRRE